MDAEKFDKVVLDLLYDELDELTRASAIRHMEQSGKAKALYAELRATKEVGALPLVEPPDDLEAKILAAEERARAGRPLHQRLGGVVSRIASYTMRPQVGMAAVLLLMIGGSMIFLRVKPGEPNRVQITERGVPESDREGVALVPVPEAPVAAAPREGSPSRSQAPKKSMDGFRADLPSPAEEARKGGAVAKAAPADRPAAGAPAEPFPGALNQLGDDALGGVGRAASGAGSFADKDEASSEAPGGPCASLEQELARAASPIESNRARWAVAECYSSVGQNEQARRAYKALLGAPAYAERARRALATLSEPAASSAPIAAAPAAPPPPAAQPKAAAAPRAAAKPATTAAPTTSEEK